MTVHIPPNPPWRPPWQPEQPSSPQPPTRVPSQWPGRLHDRLLEQRIVIAHGSMDDEAATRLSAQLLTLDAEGTEPIRLEVQSLDAELSAALAVMGVLDVMRAPVTAYAGGRVRGPALGVLALADRRFAYPSALFVFAEPRTRFDGTVADISAHEEQLRRMHTELLTRIAEVTGRAVDEIRADAERQRLLTVDQAIDYGLIEGRAEAPTVEGAARST